MDFTKHELQDNANQILLLTFACMNFIKIILISGLCLFSLTGCDLIDYHPYDAKIDGAKHINAQNIERIERSTAGRKKICFAVISDTQRWYDETHAAVKDINRRDSIDFVVHCGDLTDFSATKEFEWMRDELQKLRVPYVCLIGNHDCLATGPEVFRAMFGNPNFSFNAGNTHFVCLNTNALEHDYSVPIPDFSFIETDRQQLSANTSRTVAVMHAAPYTDQFNNNVARLFHYQMKMYPNLQFALCGHQHATAVFYPYGDDLPYYECGCANDRKYLIFTLDEEGGVRYEVVEY